MALIDEAQVPGKGDRADAGEQFRQRGCCRDQDKSDPRAREASQSRDDLAVRCQHRIGDGDNPAQSVSLSHGIRTGLIALGVA